MPKGDIASLLKFAPKEAYINGLMDGRLNMNAADYCHGLPGEQGDPLEASLAYMMGINATGSCRPAARSRCERVTSLTTPS